MRLLLTCFLLVPLSAAPRETALDRYIAQPDPSYKYELVHTVSAGGLTAYVLDMTSQRWRKPDEVDRPEWRHWLTILKPAKVTAATGFLLITGGANNSKPPANVDGNLRRLAVETGTVVAELRMVPNQPLTFAGESKRRYEDSLIAYTWDKFLRGGDEFWPARLPMTKAAVRAMDAVTSFCATDRGGKTEVSRFVVAGASKRGWTTWTTAAVDRRVVAIVPLVIDLLNIEPSFRHHWQVYGFWAPAIQDYVAMRITDWSGTPEYRKLMQIEEPFEYRDRLTIPKLIVNATGDQFFLPDSSQFYFDELKGDKYLRYVPNTDHSLRKSDAFDSVLAFYQTVLGGGKRPRLTWKFAKDGTIEAKSDVKPQAVTLWQASNPDARDFRLEKIGAAWKGSEVVAGSGGRYRAKIDKPAKGWSAYFLEFTYPGPGTAPLKFTTSVRVVPDTLPHPPYRPKPVK